MTRKLRKPTPDNPLSIVECWNLLESDEVDEFTKMQLKEKLLNVEDQMWTAPISPKIKKSLIRGLFRRMMSRRYR